MERFVTHVFGNIAPRIAWIVWRPAISSTTGRFEKLPIGADGSVCRIHGAIRGSYEDALAGTVGPNEGNGLGICIDRYVDGANTELVCVDDDEYSRSDMNMFGMFADRVLVDTSPSGKSHYWFRMTFDEQKRLIDLRKYVLHVCKTKGPGKLDMFYGVGAERFVTFTGRYKHVPTNGEIGYLTANEVMHATLGFLIYDRDHNILSSNIFQKNESNSDSKQTPACEIDTNKRTIATTEQYGSGSYEFIPLPDDTLARIPNGYGQSLRDFMAKLPLQYDDIPRAYNACFVDARRPTTDVSTIRYRICFSLTYYYGARRNALVQIMSKIFPDEKSLRDIENYIVDKAIDDRINLIRGHRGVMYKGINAKERNFTIKCIREGVSPIAKYEESKYELGEDFLTYVASKSKPKSNSWRRRWHITNKLKIITSYDDDFSYSMLSHKELVQLWSDSDAVLASVTPSELRELYKKVTGVSPIRVSHHYGTVTYRYLCRIPNDTPMELTRELLPNSKAVQNEAKRIAEAAKNKNSN